MKILIVALNSKYMHTSLSVRCIANSVKDICQAEFAEYTINDSIEDICADIYGKGADCVAFSCYIWNIEHVLKIASVLKAANPSIKIVLGGHEVNYDAQEFLKVNTQADAILHGEGEISMRYYVQYLMGLCDISSACLITYRDGENIIALPGNEVCADLNALPFAYDESIDNIRDKIIYYETSRGCPYSCSYCLSGNGCNVRFLNVDRVKKELKFFMDHKVKLVKFVDRTFNAGVKRARDIFDFIAQNPSETCFHMELSGDLIDDETLDILAKIPKGTLQFEIGVQTTHEATMRAIERRVTFDKIRYAVDRLMQNGNIHIHLDLIAGLPYETPTTFKKSFCDVIALKPHVLQLGFLKMLKGSRIRRESEAHNYSFRRYPPYEIISNKYMTYEDLLELKTVENALDKVYNSGSFANSLDVLLAGQSNPYDVFLKVGEYIRNTYPSGFALSKQMLFDIMYELFGSNNKEFVMALKKDYLISFRPGKRPSWLGIYDKSCMDIAYEIFKDEEYKKKNFPFYYDVPAKEIMKHIHAERINDELLLFDYKRSTIYTAKSDNIC